MKGWRLKGKKASKLFTLLNRRLKRLRDKVTKPTLTTWKRWSNYKFWKRRMNRMKLYYPSNEDRETWHKKCNGMRTYCSSLTKKLSILNYTFSKSNKILKKWFSLNFDWARTRKSKRVDWALKSYLWPLHDCLRWDADLKVTQSCPETWIDNEKVKTSKLG
jgi:hypothetical protein